MAVAVPIGDREVAGKISDDERAPPGGESAGAVAEGDQDLVRRWPTDDQVALSVAIEVCRGDAEDRGGGVEATNRKVAPRRRLLENAKAIPAAGRPIGGRDIGAAVTVKSAIATPDGPPPTCSLLALGSENPPLPSP